MTSKIKPISDTTGRTRLAEAVPLTTPYSVYIYPTTYCNFKCNYCAHSLGTDGMAKQYGFVKENMSLETYQKSIGQLCEFPKKIKLLSLTGQGEPLLNKDLPEMVRIAKESGRFERIEIITNGSLLTNQLSDELIESGLDTLRVSLQGISSDKYKEICGVSVNFNKFIDNMQYFYEKKGDTQLFIKVLDIALEVEEEKLFYQLFRDCTDRMFIEKLQPAYSGVELTNNMSIKHDRYGREVTERNVCPLAFFMLGVFPNGDIQPCDTLYRPVILGNVYSNTIINMWKGDILKDFWKLQLQKKRHENNGCSQCCAPTDVSHPEDILDDASELLFNKIEASS
jgi:GTP 3',8-cyclase